MVNVKLIGDQEGGQDVIVQGEFNIGRVYEDSPTKRSVVLAIDVTTVKNALREVLRRDIPIGEVGEWDVALAEYVNMCVLEKLGVNSYPVIRKNGQLESFRGGYEIISG